MKLGGIEPSPIPADSPGSVWSAFVSSVSGGGGSRWTTCCFICAYFEDLALGDFL